MTILSKIIFEEEVRKKEFDWINYNIINWCYSNDVTSPNEYLILFYVHVQSTIPSLNCTILGSNFIYFVPLSDARSFLWWISNYNLWKFVKTFLSTFVNTSDGQSRTAQIWVLQSSNWKTRWHVREPCSRIGTVGHQFIWDKCSSNAFESAFWSWEWTLDQRKYLKYSSNLTK